MQEKVNKTSNKKYFIPEIVLTVISGIFLFIASLLAKSAIKVLKKASGIIGGIIMLPLFVIADAISIILSLSGLITSAVGISKSDNKKSQIIMLVINALILIGGIIAALLTLVAKI